MQQALEAGFSLGDWRVRPAEGLISGPDGDRHVEPKVMDVLLCLSERAGEVVSHDTLIREVWADRALSDEPLFRCIAELRRSLGDSADSPQYIKTVRKRGYRLIAPVRTADTPAETDVGEVGGWSRGPTEFDGLQIVRLLGEGSMGQVFLAREPRLERLVAVKLLRGEFASDEAVRGRFEREARAAARISHPNVAGIYRIGNLPGDVPYIVMEYVEGRTLRELMRAGALREIDEERRLLRDVARGLAAAHEKRVIHRDVKPGNVLVESGSGRVVLTDFGIAAIQDTGTRLATRLTRAGERIGDPLYISPEHVEGETLTPQADVYSFGVLAFELLTGRWPYEAEQGSDPVTAHVEQAPLTIENLRRDLPAALVDLTERCLAKRPNERPTAEELVVLLADGEHATQARTGDAAGNETETTPPARQHTSLDRDRLRRYGLIAAAGVAAAAAVWLLAG